MNRKPTPSVLDAVLSADAPDCAALRNRLCYDYAAVQMVHRKAVEDAAKESTIVIGERR
ncbi:hypothetical protein [Caldilinea sp.]|jgi:hypothetical protein|uniref:hypothetical protein n=1 Tax=Caldilinea sp. TaxID=2293560 RepID=UPI001B1A6BA3|nr:hypothetical protein [Caldilinea sp.]MBO9394367.1 hypothetical protein [Caldilinea sp.]